MPWRIRCPRWIAARGHYEGHEAESVRTAGAAVQGQGIMRQQGHRSRVTEGVSRGIRRRYFSVSEVGCLECGGKQPRP